MEQYFARQKTLELRIDQTQVAREYWELIVGVMIKSILC